MSAGGVDPGKDVVAYSRLLEAAEKAKKELSYAPKVNISIPIISAASKEKLETMLTVELTRSKFESLVSKLLTRILTPIREVAIMAGVNLAGESGQIGFDDDEVDDEGNEDDEAGGVEESASSLRKKQLQGRRESKEKRKQRGKAGKEMRRLQKEYGDASITSFPSGRRLEDVILIGGATRMPCLQRLLRTLTGIEPKHSINPDEAVSLGAAVY